MFLRTLRIAQAGLERPRGTLAWLGCAWGSLAILVRIVLGRAKIPIGGLRGAEVG